MNFDPPLILPFDKPKDKSSFFLVKLCKSIFKNNQGKIGHFGTLDPFATGLVLVGIRGASRMMNYSLETCSKTYIATGVLGESTDTGDCTGKRAEVSTQTRFSSDQVNEVFESFIGTYLQRPHHFSATKLNGVKLYDLARSGIKIDKPPVKRSIYNLELLNHSPPQYHFKVEVSSGTYIRSLWEDISKALGSVGHLLELKRVRIGEISLDQAIKPEPNMDSGKILTSAMSLNDLLKFDSLEVNDTDLSSVLNGAIPSSLKILLSPSSKTIFLTHKQKVLGVCDQGHLKIVFNRKYS